MRTRRQAAPPAAAETAVGPGLDVVLESKGHDSVYQGGGGHPDDTGPETMLPLRALATDPAVLVFALLHVVALATPFLYRGFSASDAVLVATSYTARMFGASRRLCGQGGHKVLG
jgi:hypothetical protein